MEIDGTQILARTITDEEDAILAAWLALLKSGGSLQTGRIREAELQTQAKLVLGQLRDALASGQADVGTETYASLRETLGEISRSRAIQGFTSTDTAKFVFSLKEPVYAALGRTQVGDATLLAAATWSASHLLDELGLHTMEVFQTSREEVIGRQTQEIAELSTPVVQLWDGILALPLIGTLDSARTGVVMENLLQAIVDEEAEIAIIDITGVPTVDTLVAQHLLKAIAAARLMGADCIISGIRPQIAQTMVHLGVELNVVSKATLADAFALALRRTGRAVVRKQAVAVATASEDRR
jgi:rsbT co-antagonist protein RsbR